MSQVVLRSCAVDAPHLLVVLLLPISNHSSVNYISNTVTLLELSSVTIFQTQLPSNHSSVTIFQTQLPSNHSSVTIFQTQLSSNHSSVNYISNTVTLQS